MSLARAWTILPILFGGRTGDTPVTLTRTLDSGNSTLVSCNSNVRGQKADAPLRSLRGSKRRGSSPPNPSPLLYPQLGILGHLYLTSKAQELCSSASSTRPERWKGRPVGVTGRSHSLRERWQNDRVCRVKLKALRISVPKRRPLKTQIRRKTGMRCYLMIVTYYAE